MSSLTCSACQTSIYTIPDAVLQTYDNGDGEMVPVERGDLPTPCDVCPRGGPENESKLRLSDRNYRTWQVYERLQATCGAYLLPTVVMECPIFGDNMVTVRDALAAGRAEYANDRSKKSDDL